MQNIDNTSVSAMFITIIFSWFAMVSLSALVGVFAIVAATSTIIYNIIRIRKEIKK